MRTIRIRVYKFNELSEQAKQTAIEHYSEINVDYEWWDFIYDDAERVDLKISAFDIDRASYCTIEYITNAEDTANKILKEHGKDCDTSNSARIFLDELKAIKKLAKTQNKEGDEQYWFGLEIEEAEEKFLKFLSKDYLKMLRNEYEYSTSEAAIIETIEANEYEFTQDGKRFYQK